jgi:hypothetical protein
MKRYVWTVMAVAIMSTIALQAQAPAGWKLHVDRSADASDPDAAGDIKFTTSGSGFHAVNPQAAIYWNPANRASGAYTVKGSFTLLEPSNHTNYYGLIFGGKDLEGRTQSYVYFMVAQNGTWLLKQRNGQESPTLARGPSDAIKKPDASGKSTNVVEVKVAADKVDFIVNGTTVHSMPKSGALANTDGIYGMRVNHFLNVQIDNVQKS